MSWWLVLAVACSDYHLAGGAVSHGGREGAPTADTADVAPLGDTGFPAASTTPDGDTDTDSDGDVDTDTDTDTDAPPSGDTGVPTGDTGAPTGDTGAPPLGDTGAPFPDTTPSADTGAPSADTTPSADTGDVPTGDGCTGTVGYWMNHPELWPADTLVLGARTYDAAEIADLLSSAPKGDVSTQLARQLIATKLAVAGGASDAPIAATVEAADQWLIDNDDGDGLPLGVSSGSDAGAVASDLIDALTDYNDGADGIPHC